MTTSCLLLIIIFSLSCTLIISSSRAAAAAKNNPSQLINDVCNNTTNYNCCVDSLYSDPRAPTADRYVLAYISFDLAYLNATSTNDYITSLLKNIMAAGGAHGSTQRSLVRALNVCQGYYQKAVRALAVAINDSDSETFSELARLASDADHAAGHCQAALNGGDHHLHSPLSVMNRDMRALAKICIVVSKLFTVI